MRRMPALKASSLAATPYKTNLRFFSSRGARSESAAPAALFPFLVQHLDQDSFDAPDASAGGFFFGDFEFFSFLRERTSAFNVRTAADF